MASFVCCLFIRRAARLGTFLKIGGAPPQSFDFDDAILPCKL